MAKTETQISISKDPSGLITKTITSQSLTWENGNDNARSYNVTQVDGVTTISEETFEATPDVFSLDVATTTEPVESHPYFAELTPKQRSDWALWKQNPTNPILNEWNPADDTDGKMVTLFLLWQKGITTYLAPRIVVRVTSIETTDPSVSAVGRVQDPGYGGATGTVNFILVGLSGQQEGNTWRVSREYLASANGSQWEKVLYGE
jgi:hypothetical protein